MSLMFYISVILLSFLVCKILYGWMFREKTLINIPGPKGLPLVGNALQMYASIPHKKFTRWRKIYGDIFKIKVFKYDIVVLHDYESIHEMLTSRACSLRPHIYRINEIQLKEMKDIVFDTYSAEWHETKKALTRSLNAHGAGLVKIESITQEWIDKLFRNILEKTNNFRMSMDIKPYVHTCIAGIVTTLFYGKSLTESELMELLVFEDGLVKFQSTKGLIAMVDFVPWIRHLPFRAVQDPVSICSNFKKWLIDRQDEWTSSQVKDEQCILDVLTTSVNKVTKKVMTPEELIGMTEDIVLGGFATTTAFLYSLIAVLINFPEIQARIHAEIQYVTQGSRPKLSDRSSMVYLKAVMEETFRYSSILPLTAPHYTSEDIVISGKHIAKGTILQPNLWSLHHDERYFVDPWEFKPERFLDGYGQMLPSDNPVFKHTMPFGAGWRICPGESLARDRIFVILASLMQKYKFLPEDNQNIPSCDPREYEHGLVILPLKYKVRIMEI